MEFCPKCGNVLVPTKVKGKVKLYCRKCNIYYDPKKLKAKKSMIIEKMGKEKREIVVMMKDEGEKELPVTTITCPKCGNTKAYWWMQQTRSADEPPTLFYKCTKCGYTWREYG